MAIVKGGVWTNVEDEILKAAVSKYGKNQWARISSLLVRKAPKQCKARWYEWLDPGIKKVDWTRDEDEKLLHLAKLLPTQWRTIAPIVGRTSTQCLERYQKLLDDAEAAENSELGLSGVGADGAAPTADSVRRLRAGETDPDPETKPAKPDAIDMDEDEKEMLSEARARLANTQGKKAKRKQREKLLEETKRLSVIQKRRDLKAAGINIKLHHRKKGEMDYNADIPFEHKPALGFYDTTEEARSNDRERKAVNFRDVEQKRRDEAAAAEERKNEKKREHDKPVDTSSHAGALEKIRKAEQLTKRRKLNLPGPQVTDEELENIVKMGLSSSETRNLADDAVSNEASRGLIGEYTSVGGTQVVRTARTPAAYDAVNLEARNLRAMTNTQSSLLGAENTPLHGHVQGTGYQGATPRSTVTSTPHPIRGSDGSETPQTMKRTQGTPLRTPYRDDLSLNMSAQPEQDSEASQIIPAGEVQLAKHRASLLRAKFAALPAPKNDFELELPEEEGAQGEISSDTPSLEDATERDARLQRAREAAEALVLKQRSSVIQRGLPRPKIIDSAVLYRHAESLEGPARLVAEEMARLMLSDASKFPIPGGIISGDEDFVEDVDVTIMEQIRNQLENESDVSAQVLIEGDNSMSEIGLFLGSPDSEGDADAKIDQLEHMLSLLNHNLQLEAEKSAKLEKKMSLTLGGYQKRAQMLSQKLREAGTALQDGYTQMQTFETLKEDEDAAVVTRLEVSKEMLSRLEKLQTAGQDRYSNLIARKEQLFEQAHLD